MPRRTTTPAEDGVRSAAEEHTAAHEEVVARIHAEATNEHAEAQPAPAAQEVQEQATQSAGAQREVQSSPDTTEPTVPPLKIDVRITGTKNTYGNPTRATATVTLNDAFVINGFRVVMGENGLFCAMPARRVRDEYVD